MPRLTTDQWAEIRAEREAGASFGELAAKFGIDKAGIVRRAGREGWSDGSDVEALIRRKVTEKVTGVVTVDPAKKAAAINAEADRAAEVVNRHREEPTAARERVYAGLKAHKAAIVKEDKALAFEDLKAAKIAAEALAIIQAMERKAWGLDQGEAKQPTIVIERSYGR